MFQVLLELSHNGKHFHSEKILHYETGNEVIMNFDVFSNNKYSYLVAGEEGNCCLYKLKYQCSKVDSNSENNGIVDFFSIIIISTEDCNPQNFWSESYNSHFRFILFQRDKK